MTSTNNDNASPDADAGHAHDAPCSTCVDNRRRVITLEKMSVDQWDAINHIRDRPPIWATWALAATMGLAGAALSAFVAVLTMR